MRLDLELRNVRRNVTAGKHCYNGGVLSRSIEWFEEAWMLAGEERNKSVSQDQVQQVRRNQPDQGTPALAVKILLMVQIRVEPGLESIIFRQF